MLPRAVIYTECEGRIRNEFIRNLCIAFYFVIKVLFDAHYFIYKMRKFTLLKFKSCHDTNDA